MSEELHHCYKQVDDFVGVSSGNGDVADCESLLQSDPLLGKLQSLFAQVYGNDNDDNAQLLKAFLKNLIVWQRAMSNLKPLKDDVRHEHKNFCCAWQLDVFFSFLFFFFYSTLSLFV